MEVGIICPYKIDILVAMDARSYGRLATEKPHPCSADLDRMTPARLFDLMDAENLSAVRAVARAKRDVLRAVALIADRLARGGRLFFVGAGTSGRLCVLEAAECPPTFSTPPSLVRALMAGGRSSVFRSKEGAEDQTLPLGRSESFRSSDVVVAVAASGVTPFARSALALARRNKAATLFVTCNPTARIVADGRIVLVTGPEILTGSTRLKAGTATKMILNMLTTLTMIRLGKVYGQWMVDVQPRSKKLRARAARLVALLGKVPLRQAPRLLDRAGGNVKTAIVMARLSLSRPQAQKKLAQAGGFLREVLNP
jgi:N-acetylmuramic acid 6-phosphate etherase